ncbi:MAG TPA: hypothetical protein VGE08_23210 [Steroidobacter sp.]|uniref:hypothetical protein n=1 Tax=Steroidobacter sp. TaxID=1978227 RepID=UPI002EDA92A6
MAENEKTGKADEKIDWDKIEWDSRRLHKYSLEQIQEAFGKALLELTGKPYDVEIRSLNRHPENEHSSSLFDAVDMTLRVKKHREPSAF